MKINLCSLYLISFVPFGNHGNKALSTEASPDLIPDLIFRGIWMWGTRKPLAPRVEALALRDTGSRFQRPASPPWCAVQLAVRHVHLTALGDEICSPAQAVSSATASEWSLIQVSAQKSKGATWQRRCTGR